MNSKYNYIYIFLYLLLLTSCIEWSNNPASQPPDNPMMNSRKVIKDSVQIRVITFNVSSGKYLEPENAAKILMPYKADVICLCEVPKTNWSERVGKFLGMEYCFTGKVSSANQKDKYKSILSKYPIQNDNEFLINGEGWKPASVIKCEIEIKGNIITLLALQICGSTGGAESYANLLNQNFFDRLMGDRTIILGDFDNKPGDNAIKVFQSNYLTSIWDFLKINTDILNSCCFKSKKNKGITDNIFYRNMPGIKVINAGVIDFNKDITEHKPVWADIRFPFLYTIKKRNLSPN